MWQEVLVTLPNAKYKITNFSIPNFLWGLMLDRQMTTIRREKISSEQFYE